MSPVSVINWMAWLIPVLAGAVAWELKDVGPTCKKLAPEDSSNIEFCYVDKYKSKLTLEPMDEPGLYRAQLLGPENQCWVQGLDYELLHYSANESKCTKTSLNVHSPNVLHSLWAIRCPPGEFLSYGDVLVSRVNLTSILELVYGGCYVLTYTLYYDVTKSIIFSNITWIGNSHTKEEFQKSLNLTSYETIIISSSDPIITIMFQYKIQTYYVVELYDALNNLTVITKLCTLEYAGGKSKLICTLPNNLAPGNYIMRFSSRASYCSSDLFQRRCWWSFNIKIIDAVKTVNAAQPTHGDYQNNVIMVVVVAASSLAAVLIVLAVYYQYAKGRVLSDQAKMLLSRAKFRPVETRTRERDPADELKAIVLVYARDCEPFMEIMRLLKTILEERCGVKVYDIFDTAMFNSEVAASPHDWAVNVLSAPGVRVVLVKTPCGELLYESMMIESAGGLLLCEAALPLRVQYRVPRYTDTLLLFLFRLIKDDAVQPGSYLKYFVVQITNFYGVRQLPEVNPYKRYELPGAVELLLAELVGVAHPPAAAPAAPAGPAGPADLRLAVEALASHVSINPEYVLEDLLHINA